MDAAVGLNDDVLISGFSTDRNDQNGIYIVENNGNQPISIVGASLGRDGRNGGAGGGGFAGIRVGIDGSHFAAQVLMSDVTIRTGKDDDGSGTASPQYGIRHQNLYYGSASGQIWGVTAP